MKFNRIHYSIRVSLVIALFFILISLGGVTAQGNSAGTFPASPFNGMQIQYDISGVIINSSSDKEDFTTTRYLEGTISGNVITVSGAFLMDGGDDVNMDITGGNKTWHKEKQKPPGAKDCGKFSEPFSVILETGAGFSIRMNTLYGNGEMRGLVVSGAFSKQGNKVEEKGQPKKNQPPVVDSLDFRPKTPTKGDTVICTAKASDPDNDRLTFEWYVNGRQQDETSPILTLDKLVSGDYTVAVKVSDGNGGTADKTVDFKVMPAPCKEAGYFYTDSEMAKIYSGTGDPLNYNRDQLVNMMISALEDYKTEGGSAYASAINWFDSLEMAGSFYSSALPTGKEADLKKKVEAYHMEKGRLLTPGDLFYLALKTCGGDVRDALVTAHAVLYRGDRTNAQLIKNHLVPLRNPEAYNSVDRFIPSLKGEKDEKGKPKLVTPRDVLSDDQQGVWYHLFGMAALEFQDEANVVPWVVTRWTLEDVAPSDILPPHISEMKGWKNPSEIGTGLSNYALAFENIVRSSNGSPADPDKQCINYAGIAIGEALNNYMKISKPFPPTEFPATEFHLLQKINPLKYSLYLKCPISLKIEGKDGEVFSLDQAKKQFSGNTPLIIIDPFFEADGTIGLLATPLFEIKNVEIQAVKDGNVTIGVYNYNDKKVAVRSIGVRPGDSYAIDLTRFIGSDRQPQIILTPLVTTPKTVTEETTKSIEIFNSWNIAAVDNTPSCCPSFTISQAHYITYLDTYHWNYGKGTEAGGTISLRSDVGTEYGPWQTETKSGQGGVPNAWWIAYPNETIPAGTYTIIDSDPPTWSQNSGSNGCGFSKVEGYPIQNDGTASLAPISAAVTQPVSNSREAETSSAETWINKGDALYKQGKYDEAIQAYDEAIRLNPQALTAWNGKGRTLQTLHKYDEAINSYDKAISLDPKNYYAWINKGGSFYDWGKYQDALVYYEKAIELDPSNAWAWNAKGAALVNLGKYDEANIAYDQAVKLDPKYALAWNNKGNALKKLGRTTEADAAFAKAKELG